MERKIAVYTKKYHRYVEFLKKQFDSDNYVLIQNNTDLDWLNLSGLIILDEYIDGDICDRIMDRIRSRMCGEL